MQDIFKTGKRIQVSRGEMIEVSDSVYIIVSGAVGQYASNKGNLKLLFAYKNDEIFPFISTQQSNSSGRSYTFKALSRVELIQLPATTFERLAKEPENTRLLLTYSQHIVQNQIERIDNLQEEQIMQRLLERLMYIGLRFGSQDGDAVAIEIPMSHVDLATSINTTRETVNRYMSQLEELGIISLRRQMIRINSLAEVQSMLDIKTENEHEYAKNHTKVVLAAGLLAGAILHSVNNMIVI